MNAWIGLLLVAAGMQTLAIQATGQAPIVQQDRVAARGQALQQAMRGAVEQAVTGALGPEGRAKLDRRDIGPRLRAYVPAYRVLGEREIDGTAFEVQIEAQVALSLIRRELATEPAATPTDGKEKLVVPIIAPYGPQLQAALEARGLPVVAAGSEVAENPREAAAVARKVGAQAAVIGTFEARPEGTLRGVDRISTVVEVELRAIGLDEKTLASGTFKTRSFDPPDADRDKIVADGVSKAAALLVDELSARVRGGPSSGTEAGLLVQVAGVTNLRDLEQLERQLQDLAEVSSVEPRRIGAGLVTLLVRTRTGARAQVVQALAALDAIEVEAATDQQVRIRMRKATP